MKRKVTILGASLGGLVAAAELSQGGFDVTIVDKGQTVGGLYNKVNTPFGEQELGMHVVYVSKKQFSYLSDIFGEGAFNVMQGVQVDVGACANFGKIFFNSHYPNVLGHELQDEILAQLKSCAGENKQALNATEEVRNRFGDTAAEKVIIPILENLWKVSSDLLTPQAIHCFFDLRRMIVCNKVEADILKSNPWIDRVLGNPEQHQPAGEVFGGRIGLTFKKNQEVLSENVKNWALRQKVDLKFERNVSVENGILYIEGMPLNRDCDGCIVTLPMHSMASDVTNELDRLELSVYYFQLSDKLRDKFPSYYILAHSEELKSSRIVNYDAYSENLANHSGSILSVEVIHELGGDPLESDLASEIEQLFSPLKVKGSYRLANSIKICSPTLNNSYLLNSVCTNIEEQFSNVPIYFSGLRTDTGTFFSHQTIGSAYDAALECKQRLS